MKRSSGFTLTQTKTTAKRGLANIMSRGDETSARKSAWCPESSKGFTLIEILVVIAIIALLSSVIFAALKSAKMKARDSQRISNARQIGLALEQYEMTNGTYKVAGAGLSASEGSGLVAKSGGSYANSIISALKTSGYYSSDKLADPTEGTDNYYLGLCPSSNTYTLYLRVEQPELQTASTSIAAACDGAGALAANMNYIAGSGGSGTAAAGVAYVPATGVIDSGFNVGSGFDGQVHHLIEQPDGKILAFGDFTTYNGVSRGRVARLNADGSLDTSFLPGTGADAVVYHAQLLPNGQIVIGGNFTSYNGTARNRLARIDQNGALDTSFDPGATSLNSYPTTLMMDESGRIYVAGYFSSFNGVGAMGIARLTSSGTNDTTFPDTSPGSNGGLQTAAIDGNGKIIIAGGFFVYRGSSRPGLAALSYSGAVDSVFAPAVGTTGGSVYGIYPLPNGKVFISGNFTTFNGGPSGGIALLDSMGAPDPSFNAGNWNSSIPRDIAVLPDGKVLVGGGVPYDANASRYITRFNANGSLDTTFNYGSTNKGADSYVTAILPRADGTVIIAGAFTRFNGVAVNRIVRIK